MAKAAKLAKCIIFVLAAGFAAQNPRFSSILIRTLMGQIKKKFREPPVHLDPQNISATLYRLKKRQIIQWRDAPDGKTALELTDRGRKRLLVYRFDDLAVSKPRRWDGMWRIVVFDIPEKEKLSREIFRNKLKEIGFLQFQKSIWIYPFPCSNEIEFLGECLGIGKYFYLFTSSLDEDRLLQKHFKLAK